MSFQAAYRSFFARAGVSPPTTSRGKPLHPMRTQPYSTCFTISSPQTQRQPEKGCYWIEEMSASCPRSIGCRLCKGFNLSDKNRLAEYQTVLYFQAASNGVRSKLHTLRLRR